MIRLWIIRHGESENNRDRVWTGCTDTPLTDKGREEATRAGALLRGVHFDKVYASDLCRATETAERAIPGVTYETTPLLREMEVGRIVGLPMDCITPEEKARAVREGYHPFGGESRESLDRRVATFAEGLQGMENATVAAFSHAGFLRAFLDMAMESPMPRGRMLCRNCAVGVFEYDGRAWRLHSWINLP